MVGRLRLITLGILVVAVAVIDGGDRADSAPRLAVAGCLFRSASEMPHRIHVLAVTRRSVAFTGKDRSGDERRKVYVCIRGRRARVLGAVQTVLCSMECWGVREIRLTDRFVAFEEVSWGSRDASDFDVVRVLDLASRHRASSTDPGGYSRVDPVGPEKPPWPGTITDLVLTPHGTAAWIFQDQAGAGPTRYGVTIKPRGLRAWTVAYGESVSPSSLAVTGRRLYWSEGPVARSAALP